MKSFIGTILGGVWLVGFVVFFGAMHEAKTDSWWYVPVQFIALGPIVILMLVGMVAFLSTPFFSKRTDA